MLAERIAIVGAGPAGLATARGYREHGGGGAVTLIGEELIPPYRRPPLSKELLRGEIEAGELGIEPPSWFSRNRIELRLGATVSGIEPEAGAVVLAEGAPVEADALVLATGSEPVRDAIAGAEDPRVWTLRTVGDSLRLRSLDPPSGPTVVVGTGFIGCEVAASLALRGARVLLIGSDPLPQEARLGAEAATRIGGWLTALGVELIGGTEVRAIHDASVVELADGRAIEAAQVVLGLGVRPRGQLAEDAGLEVREGAIVVSDEMRAGAAGSAVLAVGDVALAHNRAAGRPLRVEHWGDALGHGEIAGRRLAGEDCCWQTVPGFWSAIGAHTLKYTAWGDGYDEHRLRVGPGESFTVWYGREGQTVGVLTHDRDEDHERGRELILAGGRLP